ncbi:MAG: hypothetical protein GXY77_08450 [Fibrobacter sp.]|nr:hypothetical protein [Fibrobacter sp.]
MKNIAILSTAILLMISTIMAQPEQGRGRMNESDTVTCPRCGMKYSSGRMGQGLGMMGMFSPEIIETDDGFIIMIGTKLIKYNENLEIENETTIPIDSTEFAEMCRQMAQIMAQCRNAFKETSDVNGPSQ